MTRRVAMAGLALMAAVVAAHLPALLASFQFDDYGVIVDNPQVHGLAAWWQSMPGIRPLLKLSYALNWSASPDPFGFHLANLLVHVANTCLVWALASAWVRTLAPQVASASWAGAAVALLFALHPATTEAVAYTSGRSVSLMALFYLGSMWLHARDWRGAGLASAGAFALALAVRETAITLPAALWLLAWFQGESFGTTARRLRWHGAVLVAALVAAIAWPGYDRFFEYSLTARDLGAQLRGQMEAHAYLFWHSVIGLRTNIDPDLVTPARWEPASTLVALCLLAALALAAASRRRWPWLGFGIAWYLLQLAPSNSLLPRLDLANDRHLYLALPGAALLLVVPLMSLRRAWLARGAIALLAGALAAHTWLRSGDYRDERTLWTATVAQSPGKARAWANLGWARQIEGDTEGARQAYECALRIDPTHQRALVNASLLPGNGPAAAPICSP